MKTPPKAGRDAKVGPFMLTAKRGEKIATAESLKLRDRMAQMVRDASGRALSSGERRALVKEALRKK